jgi:hypothetical protein
MNFFPLVGDRICFFRWAVGGDGNKVNPLKFEFLEFVV